jgi:hypothetical protein
MAGAFISSSRMRMPETSFPSQKNTSQRSRTLGRPNFDFQKRQKEIAKKKKNEEKKQRKLQKNVVQPVENTANQTGTKTSEEQSITPEA